MKLFSMPSFNKFTTLLFLILLSQSIIAQNTRDSITLEDLKPFSYDFALENGQLEGPGATILREAVANAQ